jgi:hypothetical protein
MWSNNSGIASKMASKTAGMLKIMFSIISGIAFINSFIAFLTASGPCAKRPMIGPAKSPRPLTMAFPKGLPAD